MSDEYVDMTYEEHFQALTRDDDGVDQTIDEIFEDPAFLLVLRHVADAVEKNFSWDDFHERQPSTNASFESSRKQGGQQQWLRKLVDFEESDCPTSSELHSMSWAPRAYTEHGVKLNVILETRESPGRDQWNRIKLLRETIDSNLEIGCTIQAVLEPMKVRVISKGESLPYYSMKPLQKALWGALVSLPCFRLIGRPFSPTDMLDLSVSASATDEWFSVDYSAATDGLSWKYSGRILEHVISLLPERVQSIAMRVLGPHRLHYPNGRGLTFRGVMRRGQLMGSILSFPILCLANLGVYLRTMREHQASWSIADQLKSVLVNGDDMLYAAPPALWEDHCRFGRDVGLNMSLGKSYHHPVYANVNSTSIHYDLRVPGSTPWTIDYLNVGLFFGQHKVQSKEERAESHHDDGLSQGHCAVVPLLLQGCLPGRAGSILSEYLRIHSDSIKEETRVRSRSGLDSGTGRVSSRNLFLPVSVGGLGIVPPAGFKFKVTRFQKCLAKHLYDSAIGEKTSQHPIPGYPLLTHEEIEARPWSVVNHLTIQPSYSLKEFPSRSEFKRIRVGFVTYSTTSFAMLL